MYEKNLLFLLMGVIVAESKLPRWCVMAIRVQGGGVF